MQNKNIVVKKCCHSRVFLSGISSTLKNIRWESPIKTLGDDANKYSGMMSTRNQHHAEFISTSSRYDNNQTLKQVQRDGMKGFTLIELLIVVLIIGILVAVAVPQYKKATLKNRFSTVMPMAKAVADAQEVYYLGKNMYAWATDELDISPVSAENTTIVISEALQNANDNYIFVEASRTDVPDMRYRIYQKHSPQLAGNTYCQALTTNTTAQEICQSLGGQEAGLDGTYKAYLLAGSGTGVFPGVLIDTDCEETVCTYTYSDGKKIQTTTKANYSACYSIDSISTSFCYRTGQIVCLLDSTETCTESIGYDLDEYNSQFSVPSFRNADGSTTQFGYENGILQGITISTPSSYYRGDYRMAYDPDGKPIRAKVYIGTDNYRWISFDGDGQCTSNCDYFSQIVPQGISSYIQTYMERSEEMVSQSRCELYPDLQGC